MTVLNLIQIDVDVPAAVRATGLPHAQRHDKDFLLKTVLTEAFAGPVVRPWTVHDQRGPVASVLGYAAVSADELRTRLSMALPSLHEAIGAIAGQELVVPTGSLRFSVRLCPTIHVTPGQGRRHGERDAFLVAIDTGEEGISRQEVYIRYLGQRLAGAKMDAARMTQFRLVKVLRPHRGRAAPPSGIGQKTLPECVIEGVLIVEDPSAFMCSLLNGVGRQRGYGFGYMRIEPVRVGRPA